MSKNDNLKLVYVLKIGNNSKGEGLYEFIFSKDIEILLSQQNIEDWMWDQSPASSPDNALVPDEEFIDKTLELKTKKFDLWCLHEANDRSYMDGVHTIHCLAYEVEKENDGYSDYESMFESDKDDQPLLVFHFGMSLKQVEDMLLSRDIIFQNDKLKKLASK